MPKSLTLIAAAVVFIVAGFVAITGSKSEAAEPKKNHVVWERTAVPRHKTMHKKFEPWSQPTYQQVKRIISVEANRFNASEYGLNNRINCESTYQWYASNGQYQGLGQFAHETFYRGMSSMGSRKVKMVITRYKKKRVVTYRRWSRGELRRQYGDVKRVRRTTVYRGRIPNIPVRTHGWAQVRIMAQALVGRSAVNNSEWACAA